MKIFNDITGRVSPARSPRSASRTASPSSSTRCCSGSIPPEQWQWQCRVVSTTPIPTLTTDRLTDYVPAHPGRQPRRDRPAGHPGLPRPRASRSVAVYSEADRGAPYLELADEADLHRPRPGRRELPEDRRASSRAAEIANVEAIHPGYGFLSENAHFAEVCRECNIEFIGPPHEAMQQLGNKNEARKLAQKAKVPVVPGSEGLIDDEDEALQARPRRSATRCSSRRRPAAAAAACASPATTSACIAGLAAGPARRPRPPSRTAASTWRSTSSSRGTSRCSSSATSTATSSTSGSATARCSAGIRSSSRNRRPRTCRTKVRDEICDAAVRLVKAAGYYNAGTCEFLRRQGQQLLLHRGQRPHPGRAPGDRTGDRHRPGPRADPHRRRREAALHAGGHRRTAAAPSSAASTPRTRPTDFRPSPGTITRWQPPGGPGVRLDTHVVTGYRVPPNYDSLVAKLLVHQPTRAEAIAVHAAGAGASSSSRASRRRSRSTARSSTLRRSSRARSIRRSSSGCSSARGERSRGPDGERRRVSDPILTPSGRSRDAARPPSDGREPEQKHDDPRRGERSGPTDPVRSRLEPEHDLPRPLRHHDLCGRRSRPSGSEPLARRFDTSSRGTTGR